jgi:hypothetical protein
LIGGSRYKLNDFQLGSTNKPNELYTLRDAGLFKTGRATRKLIVQRVLSASEKEKARQVNIEHEKVYRGHRSIVSTKADIRAGTAARKRKMNLTVRTQRQPLVRSLRSDTDARKKVKLSAEPHTPVAEPVAYPTTPVKANATVERKSWSTAVAVASDDGSLAKNSSATATPPRTLAAGGVAASKHAKTRHQQRNRVKNFLKRKRAVSKPKAKTKQNSHVSSIANMQIQNLSTATRTVLPSAGVERSSGQSPGIPDTEHVDNDVAVATANGDSVTGTVASISTATSTSAAPATATATAVAAVAAVPVTTSAADEIELDEPDSPVYDDNADAGDGQDNIDATDSAFPEFDALLLNSEQNSMTHEHIADQPSEFEAITSWDQVCVVCIAC